MLIKIIIKKAYFQSTYLLVTKKKKKMNRNDNIPIECEYDFSR